MMTTQPLSRLEIIGIRYRLATFADDDERSLDAYTRAGVYQHAQVPVEVIEPRFPEHERVDDEPTNVGILCGEIAQLTATARRAGKAILMTGGDCSHATGVLGGLQEVHGAGARIGLIWCDAHGDFNTSKTTLSGYLGGMPVAVCAGLTYPQWRERAHIVAPLGTDRMVLVDMRNLDEAEERLIRATDVVIAALAPGFSGEDLQQSITALAERCDLLYLHIDSDILDQRFVPNHGYGEPNGPDIHQVLAAIEMVMATGKVAVFAVVSVYNKGAGREVSVSSGIELIRGGLEAWRQHGMAAIR